MASKAICHEEADLEPKLRKAGSPPWSFGLGDTQLTCLPTPPKLLKLLLLPRFVVGEAKLGFWPSHQKGVTGRGPILAAWQAWSSTQRVLGGSPPCHHGFLWCLKLPP